MIYQRQIPKGELISAQLEMLLQNGQRATIGMHMVGVLATVLIFWTFMPVMTLLSWAMAFLMLLLVRSFLMSSALNNRCYHSQPRRIYWQLILGAALTGSVWSFVYIFAAQHVPVTMQYVLLLLIVMVIAFSLGFSVVVREYFIVYVFTSLWPIAWWSLVHYWDQPYNLLIGLVLLAFCTLLMYVCNQTYESFRNMISLTWEREQIAQELGDITGFLRDRNRQLRDARRQLTDLANVDELTGLGNRRMVNRVLQEELNRARRSGSELSMILLDVDYFKNYNDKYGHPAGDEVLRKLAGIMLDASNRAGELVARYGGEEFILLLPGASAASALRTAERLREMIVQARISHASSAVADHITVSQGLITVRPDGEYQPADLIRRADKALYSAKGAGRNTIVVE
ncbi:MAG TPA: GGDEF domain-containing protein [Halioglobus sp.]